MVIDGLLGRKVGMTQVLHADGTFTPVTVIAAGPCVVTQLRTPERDGYTAVQLGLVDAKAARRANRAQRGHHEKAGVPPTRVRREFAVRDEGEGTVKPGDAVTVGIFHDVAQVDVIGTSKGKGYQGVIRRHNFGGGAASHGSMFHRAPGSIGSASYPGRVFKGLKMSGQMGHEQVTTLNLEVVESDPERNLLLLKGSVPGPNGGVISVRNAVKSASSKGA